MSCGYDKDAGEIEPFDKKCVARITGDKAEQFFVRTDRQSGKLVDPDDPMKTVYLNARFRGTDIEAYPFIKVSAEVFDFYIKFLKSKNRANLVQANRLMMET